MVRCSGSGNIAENLLKEVQVYCQTFIQNNPDYVTYLVGMFEQYFASADIVAKNATSMIMKSRARIKLYLGCIPFDNLTPTGRRFRTFLRFEIFFRRAKILSVLEKNVHVYGKGN